MSDQEAVPNETFSHTDAGREAAIAAFEAAWIGGQRPKIADFLPPDAESDPMLLAELAHIDLECRLKAGESARVEDYFAVWPVLGSAHDVALSLIEAEYQLRRRREPDLSLAEFSRRFPQYAGELATRLGSDGVEDALGFKSPVRPSDKPPNASMASTLPPSGTNATAAKATRGDATRYRPLRLHDEGGMGEVHLAEDGELRREVALKRIQKRHADDADYRRRFLLEAEITARLQHPGIVPVYGLVEDADGQPSYAMRFIEGRSLKDAIDAFHSVDPAIVDRPVRSAGTCDAAANAAEKRSGTRPPTKGTPTMKSADFTSLEFRKLLGRFIDCCNAVAYAHSKGVVHRDLKPANVMLGEYGETLVVDWGLAKVVKAAPGGGHHAAVPEALPAGTELQGGAAAPSTSAGAFEGTHQDALIGTPQFMSPEQAQGRHEIVGPTSDVCSLGATLYVLMTGKYPFSGKSRDEVLDQVKRGEFARPREVNSKVPAALEAVCLKAMALKSGDRYVSPRTLADDIEHWLADEPIVALPDSIGRRVARWTRRHRTLTRAVLITGALMTAAVLVAYSRELKLRRGITDALHTKTIALEAETVAKNEAKAAIDRYVETVQKDEIMKDERFQSLRRNLLSNALRYYTAFILAHEHDPAQSVELAKTLHAVGEISRTTGSTGEALASYSRAAEICEKLAAEYPSLTEYQRLLANCCHDLALVQARTSDQAAALKTYQRAALIGKRLVHEHYPCEACMAVLNENRPFNLSFVCRPA